MFQSPRSYKYYESIQKSGRLQHQTSQDSSTWLLKEQKKIFNKRVPLINPEEWFPEIESERLADNCMDEFWELYAQEKFDSLSWI